MGTQNSSTPPRTESFHLRTVDTDHESSPGIPEIHKQQLSIVHLSVEPHRRTLTHATLMQINAYLKE